MNVVFGHADLARERGGEEIEALMGSIVDTGTELLETVEKERQVVDILVDHGDPGRVDLEGLLADALADVRERHPEATIEAETDGAPRVIAVPELQRAIRELLENAIEHACQPEIAIDVGSDRSTASVRIRDNGPPIPGNETEPLFADSGPSAVYHGTGLGLSLVYWTVDICGGTLSFCRDDTDSGNVVTIGLPRA
jgi:signal transduction histidine kinase